MQRWTWPWLLSAACGASCSGAGDDVAESAEGTSEGTTTAPIPADPDPSTSAGTSDDGSDDQDDQSEGTGEGPDAPQYAEEARAALSDASTFYRTLNTHGGYVWTYAEDLSRTWGEGETNEDQIWAQPPGTSAIGMVFLRAHWATGDASHLEAAIDAAAALRYGQLESGGWTNAIDFDPNGDLVARYRNGQGSGKNNSSLDDDITQSALRFLIALYGETGDPDDLDAIEYGLQALLAAQFESGGFPAVWDEDGVFDLAVLPATIPDPYPTTPNGGDFWDYPTLNDNLAGNVAATLFAAHEAFDDPRYRDSAIALGEFLLLAQLPAPQPAWAQQYNAQMEPSWARVFEPPAVTGWESQDVMETLLRVYELTGDVRYSEAVGAGLDYLQAKHLPDGRLARFYELGTDLPLYFTSDYVITYDDSDLPGHYGFKMPSRLDEIAQERARIGDGLPPLPLDPSALEPRVLEVIDALDEEGRWVDRDIKIASGIPEGDYIQSVTFVEHCGVLLDYLQTAPPP